MEIETTLENYSIIQDHRHKTSNVWKYFGDLNMNGELVDVKHVYCTKCFEESRMKKYQKSTSTGNLIKHLKRAHNVTEQASYRVKHEKDRMVVTKEESINGDDDGDAEYYIENLPNFMPMSSTSQLAGSESDNNEYLVHDINELLIMEIAKRPQIYDASLCPKNKTLVRRQLWSEIYEALNHLIEFEKLPKIWKNIRDRYQKIKKDTDRDGRSLISGKPRYRYFNQLHFLDDVECHETSAAVDEDRMAGPIDNFVSNFIFMEDEPQVDQPDQPDQTTVQLHQLLDHEPDEVNEDEEEDDDEDEEEDEEDDDELHDEHEGEDYDESQLQEMSIHDLSSVDKEEIFEHSPQKKMKLESLADHSNEMCLLQNGHPRDLMTPDNIASLLVEQHQHEILCHQHSDMSVASTIASSPSSSPQIPVATWQISPQLTASIGDTNNSTLQQHHIQQLPVTVAIAANSPVSTTSIDHMEAIISHSASHSPVAHLQQTAHTQHDTQTVSSTEPTPKVGGSSAAAGSEFVIFGSYVAEVMRNMDKQQARLLQMKVMQLIAEYDSGSQ